MAHDACACWAQLARALAEAAAARREVDGQAAQNRALREQQRILDDARLKDEAAIRDLTNELADRAEQVAAAQRKLVLLRSSSRCVCVCNPLRLPSLQSLHAFALFTPPHAISLPGQAWMCLHACPQALPAQYRGVLAFVSSSTTCTWQGFLQGMNRVLWCACLYSMADGGALLSANSGLKLEPAPSLAAQQQAAAQQAQQQQQQQLKDGCAAAVAAVEAEEDRKLLARREAELEAEQEAHLKAQRCDPMFSQHTAPCPRPKAHGLTRRETLL